MPPSEATIQYPVDGPALAADAGVAAPELSSGVSAVSTRASATRARRRREGDERYITLRSAQAERSNPDMWGVSHVRYAFFGQISCRRPPSPSPEGVRSGSGSSSRVAVAQGLGEDVDHLGGGALGLDHLAEGVGHPPDDIGAGHGQVGRIVGPQEDLDRLFVAGSDGERR